MREVGPVGPGEHRYRGSGVQHPMTRRGRGKSLTPCSVNYVLQGDAIGRYWSDGTNKWPWNVVPLEVRWASLLSQISESTLIRRTTNSSEEAEPSLWRRRGWSRSTAGLLIFVFLAVRVIDKRRGPLLIRVRIEQLPGAEPGGLGLQILQVGGLRGGTLL